MKSLLVTGGAGFIGSNFIINFLDKNKDTKLINLDALTYAGNKNNLEPIAKNPHYHFVHGNICDRELVKKLFTENDITGVIHFAAESHVDNSIEDSSVFLETNVMGTHCLLDTAYKAWMSGPFEYREGKEACKFLHISTDEVYGSLGETGVFTEESPYAPNSPYSASKAASDMIVRSYFKTYGMNTLITNCSNNFGPRQHREKLIPTVITSALAGKQIPVYGDGKNIRDWIFVDDHCQALELVFNRGEFGETYNIGGDCEKDNISLVKQICQVLDELKPSAKSYAEQIEFVKDRPGHDRRYAVDSSKIQSQLGWKPLSNFESALADTVKWYLQS